MNQTPRGLNRTLLILIGVLFALTGLHGLLLVALPAYAGGWHEVALDVTAGVESVLAATTLPGQRDSWLWIVVALVLIAVVLLLAGWISVQGRGRTGVFARGEDPAARYDGVSTPGAVSLSAAVPEQVMRAALAGRSDLVSVSVSTWEPVAFGRDDDAAWRGDGAGLQIKVQPRLGAGPRRIAEDIAESVRQMDRALGQQGPVVIHLASGARTRMSRAERVR
ncbi:hypothetical protein [Zhihengliuella salsuginis]|uniref:Alkaline shock response membrane anchor protein AmaP n=1 Tax=Zhihengliuella salsuginis TaxID=578222 RepID=A0ABQ3GC54_9MICC|nr:hypothetical protein [Zhihengliuella salsuginis]GHC99026.1 hypothetical protein GCM10008096_00710 [Zhihengliuella salsuginis]